MYDQHIILDFEMNPVSRSIGNIRKALPREIIEIGATRVDNNGKVLDTFSCFVKPEFNSDISSYITKLTGIKTTDVYQAASLSDALQIFSKWIGPQKTRIYSWSNSDLIQLKNECSCKNIIFPHNMRRWMDFQIVFPKLMGIRHKNKLMSLHEAAEWYGISFDQRGRHRALYDAKITTELVVPVLTGEYIKQRDCLKSLIQREKNEEIGSGFCLADLCGSFFGQFLAKDCCEPKYAR